MLHLKDKNKENQEVDFKDRLITLAWYPSRRSGFKVSSEQMNPEDLPPLMVRKPAWRK